MFDQDIWATRSSDAWDNAFSTSQMLKEKRKKEKNSVEDQNPHEFLHICNEWSMQLLECKWGNVTSEQTVTWS